MKIGIVTEGRAERSALAELIKKLKSKSHSILEPVFASVEPKATPAQIVTAAEPKIRILDKRDCDRILFLIDFEDLGGCLITRKNQVESLLKNRGYSSVKVVIKQRQFENWLIADHRAVNACKRFAVSKSFIKAVSPNKADNINNPVKLLSGSKPDKTSFDKNRGAHAICAKSDPLRMAENSRSFRRFLRLIEHPTYQNQSKNPAK